MTVDRNSEMRTLAAYSVISVGTELLRFRQSLPKALQADSHKLGRQADAMAHTLLHNALRAASALPIISEEDATHAPDRPDCYWLIDPLDGTASWEGGFPGYVSQVALIERGEVIVSAIHAPALTLTWSAGRGRGVSLNGQSVSPAAPVGADFHGVTLVDNCSTPTGVTLRAMTALGTNRYVECGSIGLKAAMAATGRVDLFLKDVMFRDWDIAPAMALVNELDGYCKDLVGSEILLTGQYEKKNGLVVSHDARLGIHTTKAL